MVKKNKRWDWTERQDKAFRKLKERFTKEPVLAAPDLDKNEDGSGCIGLCCRSDVIYGM